MAPLTQAVRQLQKEKQRLRSELERVTQALETLNSLAGNGRRVRLGKSANGRRKPRRKLSAATRNRMAVAQRARWAKLRRKA